MLSVRGVGQCYIHSLYTHFMSFSLLCVSVMPMVWASLMIAIGDNER